MVKQRTGKKSVLSLQEAPEITFSVCVALHRATLNITERLENIAARLPTRVNHVLGYFVTLFRLSPNTLTVHLSRHF